MDDIEITKGLTALFAALLSAAVLVINRFINWYTSRKEKKEMKEKIDSLVFEIKTNGGECYA